MLTMLHAALLARVHITAFEWKLGVIVWKD